MKTQDFDYYLPAELIAQFPAGRRTSSRLLYLDSISNQRQDTLYSPTCPITFVLGMSWYLTILR